MNMIHAMDRRQRQRSILAVILVLACVGSQANAQLITKDPFGLLAKIRQIEKDTEEFRKTSERWRDTANHYQQQLIKLQRLSFQQRSMEDSFPPRPADYGMDDMCPGAGGGIKGQLTGIFTQAMPDLGGNVVNQQQAICQRLVHAENAKYNESVTMLRTLMQRSREFAQIEQQREQVSGSQGSLAANDNEAYRFVARNQLELDYWQARMKAYDDYIAALKWDQSRLAKRALGGNKGEGQLVGKIIQAGMLKAALSK